MNTGRICVFTSRGQLHSIKVMDLPFGKYKDKGVPIDNVSNYDSASESFVYVCDMGSVIMQKLIFMTKRSMAKQVYGTEFDVTKRTVAATSLLEGDELISVCPVVDQNLVALRTRDNVFIKFSIDEIPLKKKGAVGVRCMKLSLGDLVEEAFYIKEGVAMSCDLNGRKVELNRLKTSRRDTKGSKIRG